MKQQRTKYEASIERHAVYSNVVANAFGKLSMDDIDDDISQGADSLSPHGEGFNKDFLFTGESKMTIANKSKVNSSEHLGKEVNRKKANPDLQCPKCRYTGYRIIEKTFWQRLYYVGTTLVECKKCKSKYSF